jgi:hypothetical protein
VSRRLLLAQVTQPSPAVTIRVEEEEEAVAPSAVAEAKRIPKFAC